MKKELADSVRLLIRHSRLEEAEKILEAEMLNDGQDDEVHFWMGNLRRQQNNFQQALEQYAIATELNEESPAREAHTMLMDILRFYDKERYNV